MTDEDKAEIVEASRKRRERELLIVLLLLMREAAEDAVVMLRHGVDPYDSIRTNLSRAVSPISIAMAEAHADSFGRLHRFYDDVDSTRSDAGTRSDVSDKYRPSADEMVAAMTVTLYESIRREQYTEPPEGSTEKQSARWKSPEEVIRRARDNVGYGKADPFGIENGVERQIVMASNVGTIASAVLARLGLRQIIVKDQSTTKICLARENLTLPAIDPWWLSNCPSLHFGCRSILVAVRQPFMSSQSYPTVPPAAGFGRMPAGFVESLLRGVA